jgi:hypothetical protein
MEQIEAEARAMKQCEKVIYSLFFLLLGSWAIYKYIIDTGDALSGEEEGRGDSLVGVNTTNTDEIT